MKYVIEILEEKGWVFWEEHDDQELCAASVEWIGRLKIREGGPWLVRITLQDDEDTDRDNYVS